MNLNQADYKKKIPFFLPCFPSLPIRPPSQNSHQIQQSSHPPTTRQLPSSSSSRRRHREMHRSSGGGAREKQQQARSRPSTVCADRLLPTWDPQSEFGKREARRERLSENAVHVIPVVISLCLAVLWFFSFWGGVTTSGW